MSRGEPPSSGSTSMVLRVKDPFIMISAMSVSAANPVTYQPKRPSWPAAFSPRATDSVVPPKTAPTIA